LKAFFIECSMPFWLQAAKILEEKHGWGVVYWQGSFEQQAMVQELFPEAIFNDSIDAIKGAIPNAFRGWGPTCLDQPILETYRSVEATCLKMMDRMDQSSGFSHQERVDFYHHQLAWALRLVERLAPDIAVFSTVPHMVFDYLIYEVCKKNDVPTLLLERSGLPGLIFPMARFEDGSLAVQATYSKVLESHKESPHNISSKTHDYLARLRGDYAHGMPLHFKKKISKYAQSGGELAGFQTIRWKLGFIKQPHEISDQLMKPYKFLFSPVPYNYVKQKGRLPWDSNISGLRWRINRKRENRLKARFLRQYNQLATPVDVSKPFIFVALQRQPERSTCPSGGVYVNQYLMVQALSQCLPKGWTLYVKEHRSQLLPLGRMDSSRGWDYYPRLAAVPGVRLVPLEHSPFELIDKSRATATITSTVGWESVARGKPTMVFGYPWYIYCEGVLHTPNLSTLNVAMDKILNGYQVDPMKVALFLEALQEVGLRAYFDKNYEEVLQTTPAENAERISQGLLDYQNTWGQVQNNVQ
jgi:hypothetical protein